MAAMTSRANQEYYAYRLTEDMWTKLSCLEWFWNSEITHHMTSVTILITTSFSDSKNIFNGNPFSPILLNMAPITIENNSNPRTFIELPCTGEVPAGI
jgi:hypothetical protein